MSQDRSQSHERARDAPAKSRPKERTQDRPAERPNTDPRSLSDAMGDKARKAKGKADEAPAIKVAETVATAGADGAQHLAVKWIDIWIGNFKPCYFEVSTLPGHGLEVTVEQLAYKKTYTGSGSLTTQPVPIVPIGTKFTLLSRDTTTGEVLEQKGIWYDMSGGGGMSLWALIKKLLWKGA
jgi:hypothetical protein